MMDDAGDAGPATASGPSESPVTGHGSSGPPAAVGAGSGAAAAAAAAPVELGPPDDVIVMVDSDGDTDGEGSEISDGAAATAPITGAPPRAGTAERAVPS